MGNVVAPVALEMTQFSDQIEIRLIWQLISRISIEYFKGAAFFILLITAFLTLLLNFNLNLNDWGSAKIFGSSLQFPFLNSYHDTPWS